MVSSLSFKKNQWLLLFIVPILNVTLFYSESTLAYRNNCRTRSYASARPAICRGREIPRGKTRNFKNHSLQCTANADYYHRRPQRYNFREWNDLRQKGEEGRRAAFRLRQSLDDIRWRGEIPYQTVEVWQWEDCVLRTNASECGYDRKCTPVTVSKQECTGSGSSETCRTVTSIEQSCVDEPATCWYDETYTEEWPCSAERMTYEASYRRPGREWHVDGHPYAEFLPNKYDLMPGESEMVQVFNSNGQSEVLRPRVHIGDAWNKYDTRSIRGSGVGARCVQNSNYHIEVEIQTLERDTSRESPNAFVLAQDGSRNPVSALLPSQVDIRSAESNAPTQPLSIRLADSSSHVVSELAVHSRHNADRVQEQARAGSLSSRGAANSRDPQNEGFFKQTQVRVELYKINRLWFDRYESRIFSTDVHSVQPSLNVLAEDEDIALWDLWQIDLTNPESLDRDIYRHGDAGLRPNRVYEFRVSMYQRGVPFYRQSCEDRPWISGLNWACPTFRGDHFSRPLNIRFASHATQDGRSGYRRLRDSASDPFSVGVFPMGSGFIPALGWLGEQMVHERPSRHPQSGGSR